MTAGPNVRAGLSEVPVAVIEKRWHAKRVIEMPIGAMGVAWLFSAASMRIARIRIEVENISTNTP